MQKGAPSHNSKLKHSQLPNLCRLDITYGVKKVGMGYNRVLFGMKVNALILDHSAFPTDE